MTAEHTPAQQRVLDDLLGWHDDRPVVPDGFADDLERELADAVAPAVARIPDGERLYLSKSTLDALVCDGRWIDLEESPFEPTPRMVAGRLSHRAIELDLGSRREIVGRDVVQHAWDDLATQAQWYSGVMVDVDRVTGSAMRHQAEQELLEFRDTFPLLPASVAVRSEVPMRAQLGGGSLVLSGVPDLVVGEARDDRARLLLVDLKTGQRYEQRERQDLRFYALLATLKYRQPPFRWATFYLAEGAWDAEDLDADLLRGVVRRVALAVDRAVTLRWYRPDDDALKLTGGPWCRFCSRRPDCPAAFRDED